MSGFLPLSRGWKTLVTGASGEAVFRKGLLEDRAQQGIKQRSRVGSMVKGTDLPALDTRWPKKCSRPVDISPLKN